MENYVIELIVGGILFVVGVYLKNTRQDIVKVVEAQGRLWDKIHAVELNAATAQDIHLISAKLDELKGWGKGVNRE